MLALPYSKNQLQLKEINLKARTLFSEAESTRKDLVLISDFQKSINSPTTDSLPDINRHLVQLTPENLVNISIDTVFINTISSENLDLKSILSTNTELDNTPVSLYNGEKLIAKTSVTFNKNKKGEVIFTIPANELINGEIVITDAGLNYDNQLYFNLAKQDKIKVLSIGDADSDYLKRIFDEEVFQYSNLNLKSLNYSLLESQNLIILNELNSVPIALQNALQAFKNNGGSLVIVPSSQANLGNYNFLFNRGFQILCLISSVVEERKISQIAFAHLLYKMWSKKE